MTQSRCLEHEKRKAAIRREMAWISWLSVGVSCVQAQHLSLRISEPEISRMLNDYHSVPRLGGFRITGFSKRHLICQAFACS